MERVVLVLLEETFGANDGSVIAIEAPMSGGGGLEDLAARTATVLGRTSLSLEQCVLRALRFLEKYLEAVSYGLSRWSVHAIAEDGRPRALTMVLLTFAFFDGVPLVSGSCSGRRSAFGVEGGGWSGGVGTPGIGAGTEVEEVDVLA